MKAVRRIAALLFSCFAPSLRTANADQHRCSNAKISPYPFQATLGYDHDKISTARRCLVRAFKAFISFFDTDAADLSYEELANAETLNGATLPLVRPCITETGKNLDSPEAQYCLANNGIASGWNPVNRRLVAQYSMAKRSLRSKAVQS
ncbi:MAG: hypothetical protein ACFFCW_37775 [Candidatus Hodarchaeota archaeon]